VLVVMAVKVVKVAVLVGMAVTVVKVAVLVVTHECRLGIVDE
jgi:hypothetical protein